jgi:homoserine kinase type II
MKANIPIGPRASIIDDLLRFIESQYALGIIQSCQDLGGAYNLNILLDMVNGSCVARVYRPWVTEERLKAVQAVKSWLRERQLPTILPLTTTDGAAFTAYDNRLVEVEPYVAHRASQETWASYEQGFLMLGNLHNALALYPQSTVITPPVVENYGTPDMLRRWTAGTLQRLQQADGPRVKEAISLTEKTLRILEPLQEHWMRVKNDLPHQLVHGDYVINNLLWVKGDISAIVDFDFLASHERIFDIAYALYWMFCRLEPESAVQDWSWQRAARMIQIYNSANHYPLSKEETMALPLEMARVPLYWIAEAGFLDDPVEAVLNQGRDVENFEWLVTPSEGISLPPSWINSVPLTFS